jgi:nucleotide-binding universal stress UspA family protein
LKSEEIEKKISVFQRARVVERIEFETVNIEKLILAIDIPTFAYERSNSALMLASYLAKRFNAVVSLICVTVSEEEYNESNSTILRAVELLKSQGIKVEGSCGEGYPSENILTLAEKEKASIIIIPTPYAEKAERPCVESLGTTVDIVLKRAICPVILVKNPIEQPEDIMKNIILPIHSFEDFKAVEWAFTLAEDDSRILLLNVVDKSFVETTKEIAERLFEADINDISIERILGKDISNLLANIATKGKEKGVKIERQFRVLQEVIVTNKEIEKDKNSMLILMTKPEIGNTIGSTVENLARLSSIPVLIIK